MLLFTGQSWFWTTLPRVCMMKMKEQSCVDEMYPIRQDANCAVETQFAKLRFFYNYEE